MQVYALLALLLCGGVLGKGGRTLELGRMLDKEFDLKIQEVVDVNAGILAATKQKVSVLRVLVLHVLCLSLFVLVHVLCLSLFLFECAQTRLQSK